MYAIKGTWVGQTFALAKSNESEGRKSRIRRSKEERKAMVESFIKKYQSSNNGNFPSLNLTHKEVGGSFYTVRELVREIILENRVLGPAKLTPEELNNDKFDVQYPLGSISKEPQTPLNIASNGSHFVPNHHQVTSKEPVSISDGICSKDANQRFKDEGIINGSLVDMRIEESAKNTCEELQTSKPLQAEERVEKFPASMAVVSPITAEVVVEIFPVRPVPKAANCTGAESRIENFTETLEDNEIEKVDLEPGNDSASLDQINSSNTSPLLDEEKEKIPAGLVLDMNSDLVDKEVEVEVVQNSADQLSKSSNCATTVGDSVHDSLASIDVVVEVSHNDVLTSKTYDKSQRIDGTKEINASNGKIPSGTYASSSMDESRTPKALVIENEADVQHKGGSQKGSNPTLDRIHLESWEGKSRNSTETNPLLAIFKSFVTAFIKFWSE